MAEKEEKEKTKRIRKERKWRLRRKKKNGEEGEEEDLDKPLELKEFKKEEKIYILCIDKLEQEKLYNEEEKIQWKI